MKLTLLILLTLTLGSFSALAKSDGAGNGGGAAICNGKYFMADYQEGIERHLLTYNDLSEYNENEVIELMLRRLYRYGPEFLLKVKQGLEIFNSKKIVKETMNFPDTKDYDMIILPKECEYTSLAIWDNLSGNVFIRGEIYEKLDTVNKALLSMHEAIYYAFRSFGDTTSIRARMLNAYLISTSESIPLEFGEYFYQISDESKEKVTFKTRPRKKSTVNVMQIHTSYIDEDHLDVLEKSRSVTLKFSLSKVDDYKERLNFTKNQIENATSQKSKKAFEKEYQRLKEKFQNYLESKYCGITLWRWDGIDGMPEKITMDNLVGKAISAYKKSYSVEFNVPFKNALIEFGSSCKLNDMNVEIVKDGESLTTSNITRYPDTTRFYFLEFFKVI